MTYRLLQTCIALLSAASLLVASQAWAQAPFVTVSPDERARSDYAPEHSTESLNLPQIGEPADAALSPAQEAQIGADVVGQMYYYDYILDDPELTEYLASLAWRIAAHANNRPPQLTTFMVRDPRINAFALPGGYIGFNVGLLTASESESEVAGVMAHELTHVTQRHSARAQNQGGGMGALALFGLMLAAMIAGSADPDAVMGGLAIGQSALYQKQVNFTRANELEADRIGVQIMSQAGYDPHGIANFFRRLEQQSRLYGSGLPDILRTHPVNTQRISEAEARAASLPESHYQDSFEYGLMRARARALIAAKPSDPVSYFQSQIEAGRDTPDNRYGLALAQREFGNLTEAERTLAPLLETHPRQPNLNLLMATLEERSGNPDAALKRMERTVEWYPNHAPVLFGYADALIAAGKPEVAREVLLTHEQTYGTRPDTYKLLAEAALQTGNEAEASYQMSSYLLARGDRGGALAQLDAGLRRASLPTQDRARLAARRNEVRESLPRGYNPYMPNS